MSWMRRLERRELHRSRSLSSSIALAATAVVLVAAVLLVLLAPAGALPSGWTMDAVGDAVVQPGPIGIALGAAAVVIGIVWLVLALRSGRRARHALERDGVVVVVDDATLASALSGAAARAARTSADDTRTELGRSRARVIVAADAGFGADVDAAQAAVDDTTTALQPRGRFRSTVKAGAR